MEPSSWIAPRLTGGFGNRMFQIMAAIQKAEELKRIPAFLLPRTSKCEHGGYELLFTLFPKIKVVETSNTWVEVHEADRIPPTAALPEATYGIVLKGLYQQPACFPSLSSPFLPVLQAPVQKNSSVAIHFRFGDYKVLPHHQVPLANYYKEALQKLPTGQYTLFSDEPEMLVSFAGELESQGKKVEISQTKDILQTLLEIAGCEGGFIGCNSTFGFWASWFAWRIIGEHYKAIFPDTWMQPGHPNHKPSFLTSLPYIQVLHLRL